MGRKYTAIVRKNKKNLTNEEIIKKLKKSADILEKYRVKRIGLFGSYSNGKEKAKSDIDLIVEFNLNVFGENFKGLYKSYINLLSYLENLLGRKVDILTPDSIEAIRIKEVAENIKRSIIYV